MYVVNDQSLKKALSFQRKIIIMIYKVKLSKHYGCRYTPLTFMLNFIESFLLLPIKILYASCVILLAFVGLNHFIVTILYWVKYKKIPKTVILPNDKTRWPKVTIQLPVYNERYLVEQLLKGMTELEYPRNKLEIQVLDDSTDFTSDLLKELVKKYRFQGIDIVYLHRTNREGYKGGNLQFGLKHAKGDLLAIFDADFVPQKDWLIKAVPYFIDPKVGFVQTRPGYINFKKNLVTRVAGLMLDAHYEVEQNAKFRSNLFISFEGTGGIWRKKTIIDAGGWQWDTLTEDVDMTFRSQLSGYRGVYLPDVVARGELPQSVTDFKLQQTRWAKGCSRVTGKVIGRVIKKKLPFFTKLMALLHLISFVTMPLVILMFLLVLPICLFSPGYLTLFWFGGIAAIGPILLFTIAKSEDAPRFIDRAVYFPFLFLFAAGLSLVCGFSVIAGIFKKGGVFIRTGRADSRIGREADKHRDRTLWLLIIGEILMGAYLVFTLVITWATVGKYLVFWLGGSALGFFFLAGYSMIQAIHESRQIKAQNKMHQIKKIPKPSSSIEIQE